MQQKALDKFAILTPRTSPNLPHLDPPALHKNIQNCLPPPKQGLKPEARLNPQRWGGAHFEKTKAHVWAKPRPLGLACRLSTLGQKNKCD